MRGIFCTKLDVRFAVESRRASKAAVVEERRKDQRRKLYGRQYLAMLVGVMPEDRRKGDRRRQPEVPLNAEPAPNEDGGLDDRAAAS